MKAQIRILFKTGFILLSFFFLIPMAADSQSTTNDTFRYRYPLDKQVKYKETTDISQVMDINGQSMENKINTSAVISIQNLGMSGNNSTLKVTIESLSQTVDSPAGSSGGPVTDATGKTFNITLSGKGEELDNSDAQNVSYTDGAGNPSNAMQVIEGFFPILPDQTVVTGNTWTTSDSINSKSPSALTLGVVESENTFQGFEKYNDIFCAKFTSNISGQRITTTTAQGMDIKMSGPYTGTVTYYFSTNDGYFLKQEIKTKMTGTIEISGPDQMSFPIVMEINATKEVIN